MARSERPTDPHGPRRSGPRIKPLERADHEGGKHLAGVLGGTAAKIFGATSSSGSGPPPTHRRLSRSGFLRQCRWPGGGDPETNGAAAGRAGAASGSRQGGG
jgi:hypothetical protein